MILGGALSVSGFLLQTFFSNPIAGPFVLGISSGARLVVVICYDRSFKSGTDGWLCDSDPGCVFRLPDLHGLCDSGFWPGEKYVHAGGLRHDGQLYLLGHYGSGSHLCR